MHTIYAGRAGTPGGLTEAPSAAHRHDGEPVPTAYLHGRFWGLISIAPMRRASAKRSGPPSPT